MTPIPTDREANPYRTPQHFSKKADPETAVARRRAALRDEGRMQWLSNFVTFGALAGLFELGLRLDPREPETMTLWISLCIILLFTAIVISFGMLWLYPWARRIAWTTPLLFTLAAGIQSLAQPDRAAVAGIFSLFQVLFIRRLWAICRTDGACAVTAHEHRVAKRLTPSLDREQPLSADLISIIWMVGTVLGFTLIGYGVKIS